MAAHENLNATQFVFHPATPKEMGGGPHHTVEIWASEHAGTPWAQASLEERMGYEGSSSDPGHRPIGSMSWHHKTGEITGIYTSHEHQRQGHATRILSEGRRIASETRGVTRPRHSSYRTTSGDAWARSTGDRLPARRSPD